MNNTLYNFTNSTLNWQDKALYNPVCIEEMKRFEEFCMDFKVDVLSNFNIRFEIAIIILVTFIIIRFFLEYGNFKWKYLGGSNQTINSKLYDFIIGRINFILIVDSIIVIALMFL